MKVLHYPVRRFAVEVEMLKASWNGDVNRVWEFHRAFKTEEEALAFADELAETTEKVRVVDREATPPAFVLDMQPVDAEKVAEMIASALRSKKRKWGI